MKSKRVLLVLMVLVFSMALFGCSGKMIIGGSKLQKDAFGKSKRYALVRISSDKVFYSIKTVKDKDNDPGMSKKANTQVIIDKLVPKIRARLAISLTHSAIL